MRPEESHCDVNDQYFEPLCQVEAKGTKVHQRGSEGEEHRDTSAFVPAVVEFWAKDDKKKVQAQRDGDDGDEDAEDDQIRSVGDMRDAIYAVLADVVCRGGGGIRRQLKIAS